LGFFLKIKKKNQQQKKKLTACTNIYLPLIVSAMGEQFRLVTEHQVYTLKDLACKEQFKCTPNLSLI